MEKRNEQLEVLEDVHEMLTEALKLVANEPSVGLYFVQQHVHKAVPSLLNVKHQITETTAGADLATADMKDSLSCVKSMKDCGPPVFERMIKTLQSAGNQIPTNRQSRGSFSQLLPRPIRPPGLSKAPLRSSSFLGDWHSDHKTTNKVWEDYQRERPLVELRNKKGPGEKPALPFPDSKRGDVSQKRVADSRQQDTSSSTGGGCDSSDAKESHDPSDSSKEASTSESQYYMLSLLGSAIQKAGREGVKLLGKDVESQGIGIGRVNELKNWISGQSLLRFSRKAESMPVDEGHIQPFEHGISSEDLVSMKDNFQKFQAERAARLEAWLSEPDAINPSSSSQVK